MHEIQHQQTSRTTIFLTVGALCFFAGLFAFGNRLGLAEIFLGAHALFGLPLTSGDALKVLAVGIGSALLALQGIVLVVAGLISFSRSASPSSAAASHR